MASEMFGKKRKEEITFDDIILLPGYSTIDTRKTLDVCAATLFGHSLSVPVISSPMDTITGVKMMAAIRDAGGIGIHHRYCDTDIMIIAAAYENGGIAISPSVGADLIIEIANLYPKTFFCMDVAHGHTKRNLDYCKELISNGVNNIISGNIVTVKAAEDYYDTGIDHFRVGIGNGSVCKTRVVTGFGRPQASALMDLNDAFGEDATLISDGGIKNYGDIAKAFACGASYIMTGRLFAGCRSTPTPGIYRGMASGDALAQRKSEYFVEGESISVTNNASVCSIMKEIESAIRMSCYYGGVSSHKELQNCKMAVITENSKIEGQVRY